MKQTIQKISVIGDGGWGTTLAVHLCRNNNQVTLWGPFPDYVQTLKKNQYNSKFLPGIRLPQKLDITDDLKSAIDSADLIVFAVPSKFTPSVLKKIKNLNADYSQKVFLSVTKGIDNKTLKRMSQIITDELGEIPLAVLSGPTIAMEVAKGIPSTAVIASKETNLAKRIQAVFNTDTFRIYTNNDVCGVELGGSIKNIIALACGVCDGLGFGSNTKAAILTRGLAEMARLGQAMGAKTKTFSGLSGLGDLATTCVSPQSRNRTVGEQLGQGLNIKDIMAKMEMVAEGVETVKGVYKLSRKLDIPMPITEAVYNIIHKNKKPRQAVTDLMTRQTKSE